MVMLSPGVQTKEVDYSTYVSQTSTTSLGMVGGAIKGPINDAQLITTPDEFIREFGEPTADSLATFSAIQYLQEGNKLWYVRVATDSAAAASAEIMDTETTSATVLTIDAETKGTWGNDLAVTVTNVTDTLFDLYVYNGGVIVEKFIGCELDNTVDNYVEDKVDSEYIVVTDAQDGAGISIEEIEQTSLSGGANGLDSTTSSDFVGSSSNEGLQIFRSVETYDINILTAPGQSMNEAVATELIAIAEDREDTISLIDTPMGLDAQGAADWHNGDGGGENDPSSALNSSYAACYWPWLKINDPYNETERWLPPSGFVAAQYAYNDREAYPWFAPAGLNRGIIFRALDIEQNPSKGDRDILYSDGNAVNPIVNFSNTGITIWGQRTLQREPSATDRVNVRRLLNMIKKAIAASTKYMTFDPNDEYLWRDWKNLVQPYLETLKNSRAFYDYKVEMGLGTTMTSSDIDQGQAKGRVLVKPTKAAEFINIDFVLLNTGANFPE